MKFPLFTLTLLTLATPVFAQTSPAPAAADASAQPLEITADSALEWNRDKRVYIARTNAKAVQGQFSVTADTLTAEYDDSQGGTTTITRLTAEGHVVLTSATSKATGDKAVYDVVKGEAVVTGNNLAFEDKDLRVTATEKFEYYAADGRIVAHGSPVVTSGQDTLKADHVTAWVNRSGTPAPQGQSGNLQRAEAAGHVVITTPGEAATGDRATYDAMAGKAELIGNAEIKQGPNWLKGDRAEMDLKTKVSKMHGEKGTGKVKGVFFPAKMKSAAPATN